MTLRYGFILSLVVTVVGSYIVVSQSSYVLPSSQAGYAPVQPINFSHRLHCTDNKIPCLYCHGGAIRSSVAGVPAASTCMNCHRVIRKDSAEVKKIAKALATNRPIAWVRIHALPDHVMFNHSRHVNTGITCQQCHGPVETMDRVAQNNSLSMAFCIDCHRVNRKAVAHDSLTGRNVVRASSTDCSVCHH